MLRGEAEDDNDRWLALAVWAGLCVGGPLIAVAVVALKWSDRASLARRHAVAALWMYGAVLVVYVPVVLWVFGFRGPMAAFWVVWGLAVAVVLVVTTLGVVGALRSPVRGSPPPGTPAI